MHIYNIFLNILDKPNTPRFYEELQQWYAVNGFPYEASAIAYLVEKKFSKNNERSNDPSDRP